MADNERKKKKFKQIKPPPNMVPVMRKATVGDKTRWMARQMGKKNKDCGGTGTGA